MDSLTIRNYTLADSDQLAELRPDLVRSGYYDCPQFEQGRNIICAFQADKLVGFASVWPCPPDPGNSRTLLVDVVTRQAADMEDALGNQLFAALFARCMQVQSEAPHLRTELSTYYLDRSNPALIQAYIAKGFRETHQAYEMRRDLTAPIPHLPLPDGISVRSWRLETVDEQLRYLQAQADAGLQYWDLPGLRYWMQSPCWSVGTTLTAFAGDEVAGSVMVYWDPTNPETNVGDTEHIFVVPRWRGRGIAKYLIAQALLYLREHGLTQANLGVRNPVALRLYEVMGYRITEDMTQLTRSLEHTAARCGKQ